jgi:hypothetical protein
MGLDHAGHGPEQDIRGLERLDAPHEEQHMGPRAQPERSARSVAVTRGEHLEIHAGMHDVNGMR